MCVATMRIGETGGPHDKAGKILLSVHISCKLYFYFDNSPPSLITGFPRSARVCECKIERVSEFVCVCAIREGWGNTNLIESRVHGCTRTHARPRATRTSSKRVQISDSGHVPQRLNCHKHILVYRYIYT